ncbi:MAG: response regulator [Alphaproteobacteria bacterium]|nr:MAG: response regulator [Alphaproteobacteria bacterium]
MRLKVLAVDDSATMRGLLSEALSEAGFEAILAEDGVDALEKIDERRPEVVITDINMPRMDGFELIRSIRARSDCRGMPILVLTTESKQELKDKARQYGASGWIVKPFQDDRLLDAVRKVSNRAI